MEIWKKIPGCEGLYWVSSMGRVDSKLALNLFHREVRV